MELTIANPHPNYPRVGLVEAGAVRPAVLANLHAKPHRGNAHPLPPGLKEPER